MKILTEAQEQVLRLERSFLNVIWVRLVDYNASREDLDTMRQSIQQLDDLFLIVFV